MRPDVQGQLLLLSLVSTTNRVIVAKEKNVRFGSQLVIIDNRLDKLLKILKIFILLLHRGIDRIYCHDIRCAST